MTTTPVPAPPLHAHRPSTLNGDLLLMARPRDSTAATATERLHSHVRPGATMRLEFGCSQDSARLARYDGGAGDGAHRAAGLAASCSAAETAASEHFAVDYWFLAGLERIGCSRVLAGQDGLDGG